MQTPVQTVQTPGPWISFHPLQNIIMYKLTFSVYIKLFTVYIKLVTVESIIMFKDQSASCPVFEKGFPVPRKGKAIYHDSGRAFLVGQEQFGVTEALRLMEVGDSCLLSNWATTSIHYVASKTGMKFQRQLQPDGTVRLWRVK